MEINQELIDRIKERDRKSILQLYEFSYNLMMQRISRYTRDKTEQMSIVNGAFMKVINRLDSFDTSMSYSAWLSSIIRNEFIDEYRKNKKFNAIYSQESIPDGESTFSAEFLIQNNDTKILLSHFVDALPESTRIVFNLFILEDMSREEIAHKLGITYDTVKWHILKARKIISEQLTKSKEYEKR